MTIINKNNLAGIIVLVVIIVGMFIYIDFFSPSIISDSSISTTTSKTIAPNDSNIPVSFTGTITLRLNEKNKIGDTVINPRAVIEDSRCATGVQCIWEGRVVVRLKIVSSQKDSTTETKIGDKISIPGFTLTLKEVTPYPVSGKKIQDDQYRFVFEVKPVDKSL